MTATTGGASDSIREQRLSGRRGGGEKLPAQRPFRSKLPASPAALTARVLAIVYLYVYTCIHQQFSETPSDHRKEMTMPDFPTNLTSTAKDITTVAKDAG